VEQIYNANLSSFVEIKNEMAENILNKKLIKNDLKRELS